MPALAPASATAAAPGNIVTFGDSYTSNPDELRNTIRGINIPEVQQFVWDYPHRQGCLQAPNNWPRKLGAETGAPIDNWSCTAETSSSVLARIDSAVAPGAKIILSGALAVAEPAAPNMFCTVIPAPNAPIGIPLPGLARTEWDNQERQRAAAAAHGLGFVEMRDSAAGHTGCAPDAQRYVAGAFDAVTPGKNMGLHPSDLGSEFISSRLAGVA